MDCLGWLNIIFINSLLSSTVVQHAKDRPTLALPRFAAPLAMLCTVNLLCQLSLHILVTGILDKGFISIQASRTQAENWGVPRGLTQNQVDPISDKRSQPPRKALAQRERSLGPFFPGAGRRVELFADKTS